MILHVANLDKFIPPFVDFINENFDSKKHLFYLYGDDNKYKVNRVDNVILTRRNNMMSIVHYIKLVPKLIRAEKVIVHGLFDIRLVILLALMAFVLKKCYWVIWGGDLYQYQKSKVTFKDKIKETLRAFVIKRIGYLVTYIPGDVELARKWYGAKGEYRECLMYLSNVVDSRIIESIQIKDTSTSPTNILVGNSANPSNNHFEVLDKLTKFKNEEIQIFAPLSYGNPEYAEAVIEYGSSRFGSKFTPITKFMKIDEYKKFLESIDIAIFNHKRQQAMGNTITLLGLGKTVYIRSDVSQWALFNDKCIIVQDVAKISDLSFLPDSKCRANKKRVTEVFSKRTLKDQYRTIFNE